MSLRAIKTQSFLGSMPMECVLGRGTKPNKKSQEGNSKTKTKAVSFTRKRPSNMVARALAEEAKFVPHSGACSNFTVVPDFIKELAGVGGIDVSDSMLKEIEGLVALLITVQDCNSYVGISSAIFMYFHTHMSQSLSKQIAKYVEEIFALDPQSGEEDSKVEPDWLIMMRNIHQNWQLVKDNRLFDEFSKILGLLVVFEMCSLSQATFTIKDYKFIQPDLKVIHGTAFDVVDAIFGTVMFFVENIYESRRTGSLMPFLCSDKTATELEDEYAKVVLWWDLVKNGNLKKVAGISDSEFDRRLEHLCTRVRQLLTGKSSFEKKLLNDKLMKLLRIKNDYITLKISSGVRKAPFALELFGESSQGKTTAGDQIVDALLKSAGLPISKDYRASYNPSDKYMSTWTTDKLVMFVDDVANDKSNFVERPPTRVIIDLCNNQPYYANMADLESKGKVFVEPTIVIANTNVKDLDAHTYSNCPYSIQRRMKYVLTVKAKDQFQYIIDGEPQGIDSEKIDNYYAELGRVPVFDDIWEITVEKARKPEKLTQTATYEPVTFRGEKLDKAPFRQVLQFLIEEYHKHEANQERIISRNDSRQSAMELCPHKGCKQMKGYCDLHDNLYCLPDLQALDSDEDDEFDKQDGEEFGDMIIRNASLATGKVKDRIVGDLTGSGLAVEKAASLGLMTAAKLFCKHWDWLCILPSSWVQNERFKKMMMILDYPKLKNRYISRSLLMWTTAGLCTYKAKSLDSTPSKLGTIACGLVLFSGCTLRQIFMVEEVKRGYRAELLKRNTLGITDSFRIWRDTYGPTVYKAAGIVGILYALAKLYKRWRTISPQGSLEPKGADEIAKRDSEESPWTEPIRRDLPFTKQSFCIDPKTLSGVVSNNLVYGTVRVNDKRKLMANGVFLKSNVVVIPSHYFEEDTLYCTFRKSNPDKMGGKFDCKLSKATSVRVPNTDFMICYAHSGGSFKDITPWLPKENLSEHEFTMLWRNIDGSMLVSHGRAIPKVVSNGVCDFVGGEYNDLTMTTFAGLCGAVLVSHGKGSAISGFHLGGRANTVRGCYGVLTQDQVSTALLQLRKLEGVIVSGSAEKFEKQVMGVNVLEARELHPKSPLNWLPQDCQLEYYGSCVGQTSSKSDVKVTKISEDVMDICAVPNIWGPPKMRPEWFGWQTCLSNMSSPAKPFDPNLLQIAVRDYKSQLVEIYQRPYIRTASPLSYSDNISGQDGIKFIDAIKLSTSIGYPLRGPKRKFVTEMVNEDTRKIERVLDDMVMEEITRCEKCYSNGERAYTIAKACKKDEVLSKEKCRIFYGNPIALTFLVRKYFLPIIRVLQLYPLKSECAVGINSHGPEWEEFHNHVYKFGGDRLIGGDYGKYDQKLPSQCLFAALRILIDFARECNYSKTDLDIMEAMSGDLVYALIAFNGDLVGLTEGAHISGNSLTVILNGICGSLNMRCAYYTLFPYNPQSGYTFRDYVSLMTYGDDNIGSVSRRIDGFDIKYISEFLGNFGQVYTMPDKESQITSFLPEEEFEFLKRKSVYCPLKKQRVGALIEKSIFKMLHCYLYNSKCEYSEEWACAQNIDTALREWENHGKTVYEERRQQMQAICERHPRIRVLCTRLDVDYETCVTEWKSKYRGDYVMFSTNQSPSLID